MLLMSHQQFICKYSLLRDTNFICLESVEKYTHHLSQSLFKRREFWQVFFNTSLKEEINCSISLKEHMYFNRSLKEHMFFNISLKENKYFNPETAVPSAKYCYNLEVIIFNPCKRFIMKAVTKHEQDQQIFFPISNTLGTWKQAQSVTINRELERSFV